jgi:hypothetical protein
VANSVLLDSSLRLTDSIYYGDPQLGGGSVPNTLTLATTYPLRIDGGASADLSANRTFSIIQSPVAANQDSVGVGRLISTVAPLQGGGDLTNDLSFFMDAFDGSGTPGYVPDPGPLGPGYFLEATGAWVLGTTSGVPSNRTLAMGQGLLIDGIGIADLSADRTITLELFTALARGGVPPSGGGHTNVLFADGTWDTPASAGLFVSLQPTFPGTPDTGNFDVDGRGGANDGLVGGFTFPSILPSQFSTPNDAGVYGYTTDVATPGLLSAYFANNASPSTLFFEKGRPTGGANAASDTIHAIQSRVRNLANDAWVIRTLQSVHQEGAADAQGGLFAQKFWAGEALSTFMHQWLTSTGAQFGPNITAIPTPSARLHVVGSFADTTSVISTSRALTIDDSTVVIDATGGARIITLPTAVGCKGRQYTVIRGGSGANPVDINTTSSQTISTYASWRLLIQGEAVTVESDGANWYIARNFDWNYQGAAIADGSTVANTVTDTQIDAHYIWNALGVGSIFGFKAFGKLSTAATGPTVRFRVHEVSDAVIADSLAITLPGSLSNVMWQLECEWVRRNTSTPSTIRAIKGILTIDDGNVVVAYNNVASVYNMAMLTPATTNFTSAGINTLALFAQWGTASASNTLTCIEAASWAQPATANT